MTFDEARKLIKKGEIASLRHELDAGMSPDLSNPVLLDPADAERF